MNEHFTGRLWCISLTGYGVQFGIASEPSLAERYDPNRRRVNGRAVGKTLESDDGNKRGWVAFGTSLGHVSSSDSSGGDSGSNDKIYNDRTSEIFINLRDNSEDPT